MRIRDWSSDVCSSDLGTQADLSGVGESRARDAGDRGVQIAVGEDDAGVLAAEFERHRAYAGGGRLHDRGAGARLAGKGDCIDVRMLGEVLAGAVRPEAVADLAPALRHPAIRANPRHQTSIATP